MERSTAEKCMTVQEKEEHFLPTGGKEKLYFCRYCHTDITLQLRIRCAECENFDLCGDCFCAGVDLFPHKNTHQYYVVDSVHYPIFAKDWTISEELLLLEGIEKHGLGNWKTIADYIGTKNSRACDEHYYVHYLGVYGRCLPEMSIIDDMMVETSSLMYPEAPAEEDLVYIPPGEVVGTPVTTSLTWAGGDDTEGLSTGGRSRESIGASSTRKEQEIREKLATLPGAEIAGFMPLRGDFDIEYHNDAEELLVDMEFHKDDTPAEVAMKLQVMGIYNNKLRERNDRKAFVIERGIIDTKKQCQVDRKRTKEDRELVARLKVLSRFMSPEEGEALAEGVLLARKLMRNVDQYATYRQMGIRSMDQAKKYESDRKKREYQLKAQKSRQSASSYISGAGADTGGLSLMSALTIPSSNAGTLSSNDKSSAEGGNVSNRRRSVGGRVSPTVTAVPTDDNTSSLSVRKAPMASVLSEDELTLIEKVDLLPLHYIALKEALTREAYRNGSLTKSGMRRVIKIHDCAGEEGEEDSDNGINSAARAIRRRRTIQPVAAASDNAMGLSAHKADVLFDFMVEHSANGNQEDRQRVLAILEERSREKQNDAVSMEENGGEAKRQRTA